MGVSEASSVLAASDKTRVGSGLLYEYRLRIRVRNGVVWIDPTNVPNSAAHDRLFRGSLGPGAGGEGSVLDGCFYVHWLARRIWFPASLIIGLGVSVLVIVTRSPWWVELIALLFVYRAASYLIPRLVIGDPHRSEALIREWLTTLLAFDSPRGF